jgi:hypothetical protein
MKKKTATPKIVTQPEQPMDIQSADFQKLAIKGRIYDLVGARGAIDIEIAQLETRLAELNKQ